MTDDYTLSEVRELSTLIADKLVALIQNGTLEPGSRLVQNDLAKRFGVSRVAVRDALMKLRNRGLSVNVPLRGDIVRPVTWKSVAEVFDIRLVLESHAVQVAVARMDETAREQVGDRAAAQMREAETGNLSGVIRADWEFHRSIYRHCGNTQLLEIIEDLWRRIRQARSVARRDEAWGTGWARRSIARHDRLVEAIRAADSDEAAGITRLNIQESAAELIAKLRQLGWE